MRPFAFALLLTVPLLTTARAHADDAAVTELKQGYALKVSGRCDQALPHFLSSYRISPTAKALLNLSDCESRTGDLVSAKLHATQGRELARQGHDGLGPTPEDAELVSVADELLAAIDRRMPHLVIKLAAGVPTDCTVLRDSLVVDTATLGTPVSANPGPHTITVKAAGHDDRTYPISVGEGQRTELLVDAGPLTPTIAPNPYGNAPAPDKPAPAEASSSLWTTITSSPRNEVAATLVAVGAIGVFVGGAFGIAAISNNGASNANNHCNSTGCDPQGVDLRNSALSDASLSTILFGVGLAAIGGGIALYLTAPRPSTTTSVALTPVVDRSAGGLGLRGTW